MRIVVVSITSAALIGGMALISFRIRSRGDSAPDPGRFRWEEQTRIPESSESSPKPKESAESPSGTIPVPSEKSPLNTSMLLHDVILKHRVAAAKLASVHSNGRRSFDWEREQGFMLGRLLALSRPRETEQAAIPILADPTADHLDVELATYLMGILARSGSKGAEGQLLQIAGGSDPGLVSIALKAIYSYDREGQFRYLYRDRCAEGLMSAFSNGPYWADITTAQTLETVASGFSPRPPEEQATLSLLAKEGLARLAILQSPNRDAKLDAILESATGESFGDLETIRRQEWALQVAEMAPTPNLVDLLKKRLDRDAATAKSFAESFGRTLNSTTSGFAHATGDDFYDQVLLTYQRLEGPLTEEQKRRLMHFGYLGKPEERLQELLSQEADDHSGGYQFPPAKPSRENK